MNWLQRLKLFAGLITLALVSSALAKPPAPVGEVIFLSGDVGAEQGDTSRPLAVGDPVHVGESLRTSESGYVHVRFVDGGLISVRPDSVAHIDTYSFDPASPETSEIRINLEQGALRSATGKAGETNRDRFRINTPVSAIGIRGTDFVVFADDTLARLAVHAGGVVMAPFSDSCSAADFAPCQDGAAELFASLSKALLEVRSGADFALVTTDGPTPDEVRPPHPEEARVFQALVEGARNAIQSRVGMSAPGARSYEDGLERVGRYLGEDSLTEQAYLLGEQGGGVILPQDGAMVDEPQMIWGRWAALSGVDQRIRDALSQGWRYTVVNDVFAMLEPRHEDRPLPDTGRATFKLNSYEAYIRSGRNLAEAGVSNAALVVDFDQQRFATRLDVHADSLPGVVHVVGAGELSPSGLIYSDAASPARIDGVLAPGADEAGYLFDYQVSPGVNAVGATHWVNNSSEWPDVSSMRR